MEKKMYDYNFIDADNNVVGGGHVSPERLLSDFLEEKKSSRGLKMVVFTDDQVKEWQESLKAPLQTFPCHLVAWWSLPNCDSLNLLQIGSNYFMESSMRDSSGFRAYRPQNIIASFWNKGDAVAQCERWAQEAWDDESQKAYDEGDLEGISAHGVVVGTIFRAYGSNMVKIEILEGSTYTGRNFMIKSTSAFSRGDEILITWGPYESFNEALVEIDNPLYKEGEKKWLDYSKQRYGE